MPEAGKGLVRRAFGVKRGQRGFLEEIGVFPRNRVSGRGVQTPSQTLSGGGVDLGPQGPISKVYKSPSLSAPPVADETSPYPTIHSKDLSIDRSL